MLVHRRASWSSGILGLDASSHLILERSLAGVDGEHVLRPPALTVHLGKHAPLAVRAAQAPTAAVSAVIPATQFVLLAGGGSLIWADKPEVRVTHELSIRRKFTRPVPAEAL